VTKASELTSNEIRLSLNVTFSDPTIPVPDLTIEGKMESVLRCAAPLTGSKLNFYNRRSLVDLCTSNQYCGIFYNSPKDLVR
jgi:hypothetical protein